MLHGFLFSFEIRFVSNALVTATVLHRVRTLSSYYRDADEATRYDSSASLSAYSRGSSSCGVSVMRHASGLVSRRTSARSCGTCRAAVCFGAALLLADLLAPMMNSLVSTGAVTTELIVQYVRAMQNSQATNVRTLHRLVGGKVEALEFGVTADVPFAGVPLRDLNLRKNILVAGIIRENGKTIIPSGNDSFCAGDDVIIVTTNTDLTDLRDIMARG